MKKAIIVIVLEKRDERDMTRERESCEDKEVEDEKSDRDEKRDRGNARKGNCKQSSGKGKPSKSWSKQRGQRKE